ncbi:MAG TPA: exonuclease domain-containing protein [Puia sp.]|jgi:DNA polymerase-3 subunit epsilon|nr:exonuclease domain-containing protein [Puia sp.]
MYAIVDIETTGSYAANNGITELAIVLHDGNKIVDRYETLINPETPIPRYIQVLTGIHPGMLSDAPVFSDVAFRVFELLKDAIFVAHHVNFDYSFVKHQLEQCGFELNTRKLCTVRLSRKVFPGLRGYSLGKLCEDLEIPILNRHRAGGDADATAILFGKILKNDNTGAVARMLHGKSREQYLPPNLPSEQIASLPYTPGVYYFHDQKGKVIYVGKAKNIKNRVCSHFSNNSSGLRKQEFLRNIYSVSWQDCGTELMAFLLECVEIRRFWPAYNSSLKRFEQSYGLYDFEDQSGYRRLTIEKKKQNLQAYYSFNSLAEGWQILNKLVKQFELCPKLCFIQKGNEKCIGLIDKSCKGACDHLESAVDYNERLKTALDSLQEMLPTFMIRDRGRDLTEESCILIENGRFYGMGWLDRNLQIQDLETLKEQLTVYPENDYMRGLVYSFAEKWPAKKQVWEYGSIRV